MDKLRLALFAALILTFAAGCPKKSQAPARVSGQVEDNHSVLVCSECNLVSP